MKTEPAITIKVNMEQLDEAKRKAEELYELLEKIHSITGTPINGVNEINGDVLIIQLNTFTDGDNLNKASEEYTKAIGKQCVCVGHSVKDIKGIYLDEVLDKSDFASILHEELTS